MQWLKYETTGYPEGTDGLDAAAWAAVEKSSRTYVEKKEGKTQTYARVGGLGWLQASIDSAEKQLAVAGSGNYIERGNLRTEMIQNQGILDKVVGSLHLYANTKYQELRFGAAVATAFDLLRSKVDSQINSLIPGALPILTTALENANSGNPLHWKSAAQACRDLIKHTADALRPTGPPVDGREMTDQQYMNRLMDWIENNATSKTMARLTATDLDYLGKRLDAVTDSGHKGAHSNVSKPDAARYIIGTYIFLGDILSLKDDIGSTEKPSKEPQENRVVKKKATPRTKKPIAKKKNSSSKHRAAGSKK